MRLQTRWLWQIVFWGAYAAFSLFMIRQYAQLTSGLIMIMLLVAAGLLASSELLRATILTRGWLDLAGWPLAWRVLLFAPLCATVVQLFIYVTARIAITQGWVTMPSSGSDYRIGTVIGYIFNTSIMLWLWTAGWITWQYLQRYRQGEIAKWSAEAARNKLELDVLKAQINPHFMFNALNNLRAMINEDTDKARDMVTQLSNILRHTLYHSRRDRVTVAEELPVVRDYIALEQLHYEDCLRVDWKIGDGVEEATLPPMLLQLLVENAVKHGIAKTVGGGSIDIVMSAPAGKSERRLHIAVSNPGRWEPAAPPVGGGADRGLGLNNLRERLMRVSGPGASCAIDTGDNQVRVRVEIPQ